MDLGISGKVAIVTGAARGLGRKISEVLSAEGVKIAALDILMETPMGWGVKITEKNLTEKGGVCKGYEVDITDVAKVNEVVAKVKEELGAPAILVNTAACVDSIGKIMDQDPAKWERDLKVNLGGQFNMVRAVYKDFEAAGWGRIINFASVAGALGGFGQLSYSTTKAGMIGFTKTIALEGAKKGITANCIVPGLIETEIVGFMNPAQKERIQNRTAFKKLGQMEDIAYAVAFLVSERAKYITGETLFVDGGIQLFVF